MTLSYYNDAFDLHRGDIVYVDGKLEGLRGQVVDVTYSFKIKLSDYKRVISVADATVKGEFHFAGSHFVTFDQGVLPYGRWEQSHDGLQDQFLDLEAEIEETEYQLEW